MNSSSKLTKIRSFWNKCQDIHTHPVGKSNFDTRKVSRDRQGIQH